MGPRRGAAPVTAPSSPALPMDSPKVNSRTFAAALGWPGANSYASTQYLSLGCASKSNCVKSSHPLDHVTVTDIVWGPGDTSAYSSRGTGRPSIVPKDIPTTRPFFHSFPATTLDMVSVEAHPIAESNVPKITTQVENRHLDEAIFQYLCFSLTKESGVAAS